MTTPAANAPTTAKSKGLALAAMIFAVGMTFIDQTIVAIASPDLQEELGISRSGVQWVINGYLVALAAGFALGGRITDVVGSHRVVLVGIVGFAVSSGLCGATPTGDFAEPWIITFRVTQGLSAALMIPAALAVIVSAYPISERGRALAKFFGITGALTAIGPIAGGYLTAWTWRAIFWVNLPVAVIAIVLTVAAGLQSVPRREKIDWRGAAIVAAGMALSVLGLEQASSWGWDSALTWGCIGGGLVLLIVFVLVELRTPVPLIKVRIFADRAFAVDNAVLFFAMIAFIPIFFFASVYSQVALGYDADNAGLYLLLIFSGFAPAAQIGGRMLDKGGAKLPVVIGCALGAVGFFLWSMQITDLDLGSQWWAIVIAGAGIGLLLGPASTDATNRAINASYGEVTGITQTVRNYGSALGMAVLGTLLASVFHTRLVATLTAAGVSPDDAQVAADEATGQGGLAASGGAPTSGPQAEIAAQVAADFAAATQVVLVGMAIALAIAFVVALAHPGGRVTEPVAQPGPRPRTPQPDAAA